MKPTLLIVRPAERITADAAISEQAGWQPLPFPVLKIVSLAEALGRLKNQIADADAVFWVSPTAVEIASQHLDFSDGLAQYVVVGQSTKEVLAQYLTREIICPTNGRDSEAVLQLDVWQQLPAGARVLIIRGQGGRDFLPRALKQRGFQVEIAEIYYREPLMPDWAQFQQCRPQAAYVTSGELVGLLFEQAPDELAQSLRTLLYLTHHERIADALRQHGAGNIQLINRLNATALIKLRETEF